MPAFPDIIAVAQFAVRICILLITFPCARMPHCELCNNLERKAHACPLAFDFRLDQLDRSANSGCYTCSLRHRIGGVSHVRRAYVWGETIDGNGSLEVELYLDHGHNASDLKLEFFLIPGGSLFSIRWSS
jgi:hypothetical protein